MEKRPCRCKSTGICTSCVCSSRNRVCDDKCHCTIEFCTIRKKEEERITQEVHRTEEEEFRIYEHNNEDNNNENLLNRPNWTFTTTTTIVVTVIITVISITITIVITITAIMEVMKKQN